MGNLGSALSSVGNFFGNINPASGLAMVGNPMSGIGMLGALLGKGDSSMGANPAEALGTQEANPGEKMFGMSAQQPGTNGLGAVDPRGIISESGAMPQNDGDGDEPLQVTGDGWHPRKQTFLGALADAFLMSRGGQPAFANARNARNVNEAMGGFTQDPTQAIRRLSQIPGQEGNAWKMYDQMQDNERANLASESLRESRQGPYLKRIGGLLNAIQNAKDPAAAYKTNLPVLRALQKKAGDDSGVLGDEYNPDAIQSYVGMNVDPEDQIKQEALARYRQDRLDLDRQKATDLKNYRADRLEDFDNAQATRDKVAARPRKGDAAAQTKFVRDRQGNVVGKVGASGKTAQLVAPDGGFQYFEVMPDGSLGKRLPNELFEKPKGK